MKLFSSTDISSPPDVVFPWIAEPQKARVWQKNVKSEEIIVSEPGMVGTTFTETVEEEGRELRIDGVVTDYEPDRLIAFHLASRIHELDVRYSLRATDSATTVSTDAEVNWKFPMNLVSLLAGGRIRRQLEKQLSAELEELKRLCEGGRHGETGRVQR